ncbi:MAG: NAD-binding protein [Planctomycetota bacterium]|nr:NAD-binding protein [Planctomycetota bacterium]
MPNRPTRRSSRAWREWCFVLVAFRHFRIRFAIMMVILLGGGVLFKVYAPEEDYSFLQAMFHSWSLVFAELPDEFPESLVLDIALFVFPILGLSVIFEGIIDFSLMMRDRRRFERSWCTMLAKSYKNHIVLVGFGRLGYRTFLLLRKMGEAVVVIERNDQNQFLEELRRDGSPLLVGDARREALIADANIIEARSIILATDDDMANLEIALDARKINPKIRVVLRMFDQQVADKVGEGFDIHLAMSQSALSAPSFATAAVAPGIINSYAVGNRLMAIQRWLVREAGPLVGLSISEVIEKYRVNVVEHVPGGGTPVLVPTLGTTLKAGDGLMVQAPIETLAGLHDEMFALTSA